MRKLIYIVQKEFIQIFRNKALLPIMTIAPIVQLIVLSFAADNEVRNVNLAIVTQDRSSFARLLIAKIEQSQRFKLLTLPPSTAQATDLMQRGQADIVLTIPYRFERSFFHGEKLNLQILANAINGQQALVGASYLAAIVQDFSREITQEYGSKVEVVRNTMLPSVSLETRHWYNEDLNYKDFMVPGILGELVTILVMLLTAMNVVREREIGTIEQINVTPIRKWQFIIGKMIPFLILGLVLLTVGLIAGKIIFDIPMRGSLWVVFAFCVLNITAVLGLGLFISNLVNTQQQAMFVAFFFVIIFILMCGLFTPIESMPTWAQYLTIPNPVAHFVEVMRSVLLKGSTFYDVRFNFQVTFILAIIFNTVAVWSYRKVV